MTTAAAPLRIVELKAENVKRIRAVEIRPEGNLVEITGRNGQGKSSILDAIWWALAGASTIQRAPIRKGQDEARIRLDLGTVKVTRTFRKKDEAGDFTTSIVVENEDGARFPSPQRMLDALVGELSFDPLAFARMESREQFETLRRFVPGVDFAEIDRANKADFEARAGANRRAKELRAQAAGIVVPDGVPAERVDDAELVASLEQAGEHNATLERRKARRDQSAADIVRQDEVAAGYRRNAADLRRQADAEDAKAAEHEASVADLREKFAAAAPLPEPINTFEVRARITAARNANDLFDRAARSRSDLDRLTQEAAAEEARSASLTAAMERRAAGRRAAIASAKMPVDGIEFGDGEILLNGVPFDQGSDAERLRASIAIAMAANPRLRVIRVRDGSLLDQDAMRLLAEMAEAQEYQVWVERVEGDGKMGFVIEDGALRPDAALMAAE